MIDVWLRSGALAIILIPFVLIYDRGRDCMADTSITGAAFFASCIGIAGPFFTSVAVLFGLFSAFLANDVQHRNAEVKAAIFREADGVRTILRLDEALAPRAAGHGCRAWTMSSRFLPRNGRRCGSGSARPKTLARSSPSPSSCWRRVVRSPADSAFIRRCSRAWSKCAKHGWSADIDRWRHRTDELARHADPRVLTQIAVAVVQLEQLRPQAFALLSSQRPSLRRWCDRVRRATDLRCRNRCRALVPRGIGDGRPQDRTPSASAQAQPAKIGRDRHGSDRGGNTDGEG